MKLNIDESICVGCRICEQACVFGRQHNFSPDAACIQVLFNDDGGIKIEMAYGCEDCQTPLCTRFCPVGAITVDRGEK